MTPDTIRSEIFIEAGIDHVWSLVSRTGFWIGDDLCFAHDGKRGRDRLGRNRPVRPVPGSGRAAHPAALRRLPLDQRLPRRHARTGQLNAGRIHPVEQENGVLVRVKESGFAGLLTSPEIRAARHADNVRGWTNQLEHLRQACESDVASDRDMSSLARRVRRHFRGPGRPEPALRPGSPRRCRRGHCNDTGGGSAVQPSGGGQASRPLGAGAAGAFPAPGARRCVSRAFRQAGSHRPGHRRDRRRLGSDPDGPKASRRGDGSRATETAFRFVDGATPGRCDLRVPNRITVVPQPV